MQEGNVSSLRLFFRKKWVIGVLICDAVLVIVAVVLAIVNANKTVVLKLDVVPADSQITVNGVSGYSNGEYRVAPGAFEVEISHEGLGTKRFTVDLEHQDMATVTAFLADDNFNYYRLRENLGDFAALERIASANSNQTTDGDKSAEAFIAKFRKNYDLYSNEIPIYYVDYIEETRTILKSVMIDSGDGCDRTICVKVIFEGTNDVSMVNDLLLDAGFDMEEVQIEY